MKKRLQGSPNTTQKVENFKECAIRAATRDWDGLKVIFD